MNYRLRDGVARVSVCGAMLLVPSRAASEYCPGILRVNFTQRVIWMTLERGQDLAYAASALAKFSFKTVEEIQPKVDEALEKLVSYGFLIAEEDDHAQG